MHLSLTCVVIREYAFNMRAHLIYTVWVSQSLLFDRRASCAHTTHSHIIYDDNWRISGKRMKSPPIKWTKIPSAALNGQKRIQAREHARERHLTSTANMNFFLNWFTFIPLSSVNYHILLMFSLLFFFFLIQTYYGVCILAARKMRKTNNGCDSTTRKHHAFLMVPKWIWIFFRAKISNNTIAMMRRDHRKHSYTLKSSQQFGNGAWPNNKNL